MLLSFWICALCDVQAACIVAGQLVEVVGGCEMEAGDGATGREGGERCGLLANSVCFVSKCVLWCFAVFCGCFAGVLWCFASGFKKTVFCGVLQMFCNVLDVFCECFL